MKQPQIYKSFHAWSNAGYRVIKGAKSKRRVNGIAVFSLDQVYMPNQSIAESDDYDLDPDYEPYPFFGCDPHQGY